MCCHGNGILWQKLGEKSCIANYFLSFSPILMKFGTDVCLRCARRHFLTVVESVLPWYTRILRQTMQNTVAIFLSLLSLTHSAKSQANFCLVSIHVFQDFWSRFKLRAYVPLFLVAIASGQRVSALHALSIEPGHVRWEPAGVRLVPRPNFIAKSLSISVFSAG